MPYKQKNNKKFNSLIVYFNSELANKSDKRFLKRIDRLND